MSNAFVERAVFFFNFFIFCFSFSHQDCMQRVLWWDKWWYKRLSPISLSSFLEGCNVWVVLE
jgi:hypothetical protein